MRVILIVLIVLAVPIALLWATSFRRWLMERRFTRLDGPDHTSDVERDARAAAVDYDPTDHGWHLR